MLKTNQVECFEEHEIWSFRGAVWNWNLSCIGDTHNMIFKAVKYGDSAWRYGYGYEHETSVSLPEPIEVPNGSILITTEGFEQKAFEIVEHNNTCRYTYMGKLGEDVKVNRTTVQSPPVQFSLIISHSQTIIAAKN